MYIHKKSPNLVKLSPDQRIRGKISKIRTKLKDRGHHLVIGHRICWSFPESVFSIVLLCWRRHVAFPSKSHLRFLLPTNYIIKSEQRLNLLTKYSQSWNNKCNVFPRCVTFLYECRYLLPPLSKTQSFLHLLTVNLVTAKQFLLTLWQTNGRIFYNYLFK